MNSVKINLLVAGGVVAATGAFTAGVLVPGMRELSRTQGEINETSMRMQGDQQAVGDISDLYASILHMDKLTRDFRTRLPAERDFGSFLNDISEQLKDNGVQDYVIQPRPAVPLDDTRLPQEMKLLSGTTILPVLVSFESDFATCFSFMKGLEALPRLSHVERLRMDKIEGRSGALKVEMEIHTYYKPDAK